jgi:hypothetical protein
MSTALREALATWRVLDDKKMRHVKRGRHQGAWNLHSQVNKGATFKVAPSAPVSLTDVLWFRNKPLSQTFPKYLTHKALEN